MGSEDKHTYTKCSGGLRDARLRFARKVETLESKTYPISAVTRISVGTSLYEKLFLT